MSKPILVEELVFWNPITDPTDYLDEFDAWRHLFLSPEAAAGKQEQEQEQEHEQQNKNRNKNKKDDGNGNAAAGEDVFSSMLTEVFLPRVRAVALEWNARDYEPMINFFLLWTPVLTQTIRDYIAANVILPRLQAEVGAWSPRTDPVPVHLWLHPWLPVLGAPLLEPLWAPIRHKMCAALEAWQPADPSAHAVLAPWAPVFGAAAMAALLRRSVVPKLAAALRRHEVTAGPLGTDPQELPRAELVARLGAEAFVWAAAWTDLLGADAAAQLLEAAAFFQGWARALLAWVAGTGKVDAEVGWWYQGWKLLFPEALVKHKTVQRYLRYALDLMGCALAGKPYPPLPAAATITTAATGSSSLGLPAEAAASSRSQTSLSLLATQQHVGLTLREVLEQLAARTNVLFTPTTKTHEGKDVYKFGSTSVVVDSKLVYAHNTETGKWESVTLDELMRRNNSGSNAPSSSSYDDVE